MVSKVELRFLRMAPRKVRAVADLIRGRMLDDAITLLRFCRRQAARPMYKLLKSAAANASSVKKADLDELEVSEVCVGEGPTLKRWMPRAHGRATRINKKTSHVVVELDYRQ